ncbi:hypothetical protein Hypma_010792 [Hypsizygus marmoreus]|uniref:Uncharacterized protein n=1 Tax=Hypsizygus marmoreus TaxID=39966 RepID=A0A369JMN9_HYPMA|nr:hypothetical protein Hypma_010792 [Hypsizygus marmoreus]
MILKSAVAQPESPTTKPLSPALAREISNSYRRSPSPDMATFNPLLLPSPPPLRNKNPDDFFPVRVFGFHVTRQHLDELADKFSIPSEKTQDSRQQLAWRELLRRRPKDGLMRIAFVYYNEKRRSWCLMLASNVSQTDMARAQNLDLIQRHRDLLKTDATEVMPRWYRMNYG